MIPEPGRDVTLLLHKHLSKEIKDYKPEDLLQGVLSYLSTYDNDNKTDFVLMTSNNFEKITFPEQMYNYRVKKLSLKNKAEITQ